MKSSTFGGLLGVILLCDVSHAATIFTVPVGNPGNADDPRDSLETRRRGSVTCPYRIGKYEVTNAQYAAFLNEKAAERPAGSLQREHGQRSPRWDHAKWG